MYINLTHTPTYYAHFIHAIFAVMLLFFAFRKVSKRDSIYKRLAWAILISLGVALTVDIVFHKLERVYNFNQQPYIHFAEPESKN
jgi:ABC-type Mn2+/Zn2+ transport system permease subunit